MDTIRAELERVFQLVAADAEAAAQARFRQQQADVADLMQQHARDLEEREAALAAAMELASVDPRVQAAFRDGIAEERGRVLALIDHQIEMLGRASISRSVLCALQRAVEGVQ